MRFRATRVFALVLPVCMMLSAFGAYANSLPDFTGLVKKASPAVVNISTTQHITGRSYPGMPDLGQGPFGDWFRHFFGDQLPPPNDNGDNNGDQAPPDNGRIYEAKSLGSGFIISKDGYILTNYHVVKDADEIIVKLSDRRQFPAKVIGEDELSDIALLKIDASKLPVVNIGSDDKLEVGEWVLAIGSPYGFDHSVTAGIVSAKGRSLSDEQYVPFIQTDVAINPGNSGGPLLDTAGEVVGINSQIYSRTGGYMGLSFAIPIDVAMKVADQLKKNGHVVRGWLGVVIQSVDRGLAKSFGMKRPEGALIARVLPGSPAEKGGLRVGDVIMKFGDEQVNTSGALPPLVGRAKPGDQIKVEVLRNGQHKIIKVKVGELPENRSQASTAPVKPEGSGRLGLAVDDLTADQRQKLGVDKGGVLVTQVTGGAARDAGIHPGDLITMVSGKPIQSKEQFNKVVAALPDGDTVAVLVQRRGQPLFLALEVPKSASQQ